jgi:phenylacetate-CoA ligase
MTPAGRDLIEQRFGVPVLQSYCTTEVLRVGHFCELRRGFHVNDDLCHIVLVDGDGVPVADGERGEVVISNLVNRGTVVLNYRLGDVARLDPSPCPCGRTLRLLTDLEGRVDDVVRLADGGHVHPLSISRELRDAPGLLRWQLVQFGDDRFELRLMTADDDAFARLSGDLTRRLSRVLRGADVAAIRHATLPAGRGGKFRAVVAARPRPPGAEATPFVHGAVRDVAGRAT